MLGFREIPVFVVDDNRMYLKALTTKLEQIKRVKPYGYETGEECLKHLDLKPKLVITDYYLNSEDSNAINGVELIKKLREYQPDLPVIVLSGRADLSDTSHSSELEGKLMFDPKSIKEDFKQGKFFYFMKNNEAPQLVADLTNDLRIKKVLR